MYLASDAHKDTTAVALRERGEPVYWAKIAHLSGSFGPLSPHGEVLSLCCDANLCGYRVYRAITEAGHEWAISAAVLIVGLHTLTLIRGRLPIRDDQAIGS